MWHLILDILDVGLEPSLLVGLNGSKCLRLRPLRPEERVGLDVWVVDVSVVIVIMSVLPEKSLLELMGHLVLHILDMGFKSCLFVGLDRGKRLRGILARCLLRPEEGVRLHIRVVHITVVIIVVSVLPKQ